MKVLTVAANEMGRSAVEYPDVVREVLFALRNDRSTEYSSIDKRVEVLLVLRLHIIKHSAPWVTIFRFNEFIFR